MHRFAIPLLFVMQLAQGQIVRGQIPLQIPWNDKPVARWSDSDAHLLLSESPWSKQVEPVYKREGGSLHTGIGQIRGGIGGIGIGKPRMGGPRGGMGRRPGGRGGMDQGMPIEEVAPRTLSAVTIRWESALPVQEAELKVADGNAPIVDEANYTIAVVGLPGRLVGNDPQALAKQIKGQAKLKRDGKKDIKPSEVRVLPRDEGLVVMILFSRTSEISVNDRQIDFEAMVGPLELKQSFNLSEMNYAGKLEL